MVQPLPIKLALAVAEVPAELQTALPLDSHGQKP